MFASGFILIGLVTLAIPWWLHRLRTHSPDKRLVSSLFLMERADIPVTLQRRLQYLVLLALRLGLLAVLIVAFAGPTLRFPGVQQTSGDGQVSIIVIDTSLSMASSDGLRGAKEEAREIIEGLASGAAVALVSVNHELSIRTALTTDREEVFSAINQLSVAGTHLNYNGIGTQLDHIVGSLTETDLPVTVHLISDFQASAMPDTFNSLLHDGSWSLNLHQTDSGIANWRIEAVSIENAQATVLVRGHNTPASVLDVTMDAEGEQERGQVAVSAAGSGQLSFDINPSLTELTFRLEQTDALGLDNSFYVAQPTRKATPLPVIGMERADGSLTYLTSAVVASAPRFEPVLTSQDNLPDAASVVVLMDPSQDLPSVQTYLMNGGAVLATLGPKTLASGMLPLTGAGLTSRRFDTTARSIVPADPTHPVLAGTNWQNVLVYQRLMTDSLDGQVILSYDDGQPLLMEYRVGAGRMLVLLTALDPSWTSLVVQPVFVQFIQNALAYLAEDQLPQQVLAGFPVVFPSSSLQLFAPDGSRALSLSDTINRPVVRLEEPGLYQLRTPGNTRTLAVNTPASESDLTPAAATLLSRWQRASIRDAAAGNTGVVTEGVVIELGKWLLILLMLLALAEPLIANTTRRTGTAS